jgi:RNA polymerase sigma-70 factor, ECF subfamily
MNAMHISLADTRMLDRANCARADSLTPEARAVQSLPRMLDGVWQANQARLVRLAIGLGLRSDQAADVLQDVYVMAMEKPPAIDDHAELFHWLVRVTINRCHLEHRRRARWRRLWSSLARACSGSSRADDALVSGELKQEVERALATLAAADRALVVMRYFSDLNSREIAQIVGMPESTVRGRLRAVRQELSTRLADIA